MEFKDWLVPLLTIVGSFGGAYYAAQLALSRFTSEKVWEKKSEAYTSIFEALHHMKNRFDALREETAITGEVQSDDELLGKSREAYAALRIRLDKEMWLIPESVRKRLDEFLFDVDHKTAMSQGELYLYLSQAAERVMHDVRALARADLGVDR